jgi:hypothetical protein
MLSSVDGVSGKCESIKLLSNSGHENELVVESVRIRRASELEGSQWLVEANVKGFKSIKEKGHFIAVNQMRCRMRSETIDNIYTIMDLNFIGSSGQTISYGASVLCLEMAAY